MAKKVIEVVGENTEEPIVEESTEPDLDFEKFFDEAVLEKLVEEPNEEERLVEEKIAKEKPTDEKPVEEKLVEEVKEETPKEDPRIAALEKEVAELRKPKEEIEVPKGPTPEEIKAYEVDQAAMGEFEKNWPDHAAALKIQQKQTLAVVEKIFRDIVDPLFKQIPELQKSVSQTVEDKNMNTVLAAHPDARDLLPEVEKWIPSLPAYLQKAANQTLDNGTPQDVIDLFADFKEATGRVEKEVKEEKKVNPAENPRVQSMMAVKSSRTSVKAAADPGDFDSAFDEALKEI